MVTYVQRKTVVGVMCELLILYQGKPRPPRYFVRERKENVFHTTKISHGNVGKK